MSPRSESERLPRILLVHGTFARKSPWTFPGSALHTELSSRFPGAIIDRHEWSGANRHRKRGDGADALAKTILLDGKPTVIVAHSHGGNVAQQSLAGHTTLQERTRVITVGTPFLHYRNLRHTADIHQRPLLSWGRVSWLAFSLAMGFSLAYGMVLLDKEPGPNPDEFATWIPLNEFSKRLASFTVGLVAAMAIIIIGVVALSLLSALLTLRGAHQPQYGPRNAHSDAALAPPITVIRTKGDEAAILLRVGTRLSTLVDRTRWVADRLPTWAALPSFLVALALVGAVSIGAADLTGLQLVAWVALRGFPSPEVVAIVAALAAAPAAIAIVATGVALVEAVTCGFDGVPVLTHGRVSMRPEPKRLESVTEVELQRGRRFSLRHSRLLIDPRSVHAIADACASALESLGAIDQASTHAEPGPRLPPPHAHDRVR